MEGKIHSQGVAIQEMEEEIAAFKSEVKKVSVSVQIVCRNGGNCNSYPNTVLAMYHSSQLQWYNYQVCKLCTVNIATKCTGKS